MPGLELDLVVDLEVQQQLGHLHAVIGERGGELRLLLDVVRREAEALLRFDLRSPPQSGFGPTTSQR